MKTDIMWNRTDWRIEWLKTEEFSR